MARYRGPKDKLNRRFGVALFGPSKSLERRAYGPGQHGPRRGRRKQSDYAVALAEKQKLKFQYGVLEKQFRRYFAEASRRRGITGEILLQLLESRLDNVVYRLGMANTRSASRQFVSHGHVLVNGSRVDVPSYVCKPGDVISVRENARSRQVAIRFLDITQAAPVPDWVSVDRDALTGTFARVPSREEIAPIVNEQLIVELYSR